jgi:hypothetical protein
MLIACFMFRQFHRQSSKHDAICTTFTSGDAVQIGVKSFEIVHNCPFPHITKSHIPYLLSVNDTLVIISKNTDIWTNT